ncbi:MAG: Stp1/IreP family PP2C-type Ser/Thr phosphatase [Clostridia bacterium]|nr:Stp1/IreP family PP2C-type Ser/Thr phosphatase [Clostridia bacterium]
MTLAVSAATDVGRWRQRNEDAYWAAALDRSAWVLAVADGMGGYQAGDVASRVALETLARVLPECLSRRRAPGACLREAIAHANARILELGRGQGELAGMGTTLTAAVVLRRHLWVGHVGDSRAYLIRDGAIRQLTEDHSVVGELLRAGSIDEAGAMSHPQRHLLTRGLGLRAEVEVDVADEALLPGDVVVVATDGLTSLVTSTEVMEHARRAAAAGREAFAQVADRLVALANERGGYDNITVLLALVPREEPGGAGGEAGVAP